MTFKEWQKLANNSLRGSDKELSRLDIPECPISVANEIVEDWDEQLKRIYKRALDIYDAGGCTFDLLKMLEGECNV